MVNQMKKQRPGRVISSDEMYLLRIDPDHLYSRDNDDGRPLGTRYPSVAAHMSYAEADALCQRLRAQGYRSAFVSDIRGDAVSIAALEAARVQQEERAARFWGTQQEER